ncbi:centromere protein L [Salarias fasciatus]|uniref:Centromere protein L n=1 Tax=Salarias fasciatus TaxID=181472 RepID=A0A672IWN0_SALFA|nr:centromere protein L [Salarias fasciatus]
MEPPQRSMVRTPHKSVLVQRRSKSRSYRQSYRSCSGGPSRLCLTPALTARRLNTSRRPPKSQDITDKLKAEHLALLVKTRWKLSYVTPLYRFRHTQLRSYSRQLSAFIAAEQQRGVAVEVEGTQSGFRVSFSMLQGLASAENDDPETVLIQVHSKPLLSRQDEPQKLVWSGWLTCISGNPEYLSSLPRDFTCLPLFGSSGADGLTSVVKSWIQQTFDCCLGRLELNHTTLQWLLALWTNCHAQSNIQQLNMVWTLPSAPPLQVSFTVDPQDAWDLWRSVRKASAQEEEEEEEESCIDVEEVTRFLHGLKSHFYRHFRLELSAGSLSQVGTALGWAAVSGRIKMSSSRYVVTTLALLTECALLKMPI